MNNAKYVIAGRHPDNYHRVTMLLVYIAGAKLKTIMKNQPVRFVDVDKKLNGSIGFVKCHGLYKD